MVTQKYKPMKKTSYIVRFAVGLTLTLLASNSVFCQDTVRMNDKRFLYPQIPSQDWYFSRWDRETVSCFPIAHGWGAECAGYECTSDKEPVTIYGIAIPLEGNLPTNRVLWLKIMDSIPGDGSNTILDSVRITQDSEQKTLIFEEIITTEDGELTDSIAGVAHTLYCGYFDRPVQVRDSSFFVYAHAAVGEIVIPKYRIHPNITRYNYDGYSHYWYRDSNYAHVWFPLLPIIAPPPEWIDDPDDPQDPENPGGDEGIGEAIGSQQSAVSIYPNPASGYAVVTCDTPIQELTLCDINGRMIISLRNCGESAKIDTSALVPGVYMLKVTTEAGTATRKLAVRP